MFTLLLPAAGIGAALVGAYLLGRRDGYSDGVDATYDAVARHYDNGRWRTPPPARFTDAGKPVPYPGGDARGDR